MSERILPWTDMVPKAINGVKKKFRGYQEDSLLNKLESFKDLSMEVVPVLNKKSLMVFSHNDLFPNSVFLALDSLDVTIVDWEYSTNSYQSNDLAKLGCHLSDSQFKSLIDSYYHKIQGADPTQEQTEHLRLNMFILKFLDIAWKINAKNFQEYDERIRLLEKERDEVKVILNSYIESTSDVKSTSTDTGPHQTVSFKR